MNKQLWVGLLASPGVPHVPNIVPAVFVFAPSEYERFLLEARLKRAPPPKVNSSAILG